MLGIGRYSVTVELPRPRGLYPSGNVTYRGTEVGRVDSVQLTDTGVAAVLSLKSGIDIPSDLDAQVHSQSAVGEQYVALLPRRDSPPLKNGDVIPANRVSVPPDLDALLDATNRGMEAIPRDDLKTVVDEAYTAVGGLGPDISRLVTGSSSLAIDARKNLDPLLTLIDQSKPVLGHPDRFIGCGAGVGRASGQHHATAAEKRHRRPWRAAARWPGRRGSPSAVRPAAADAADRAGQSGQRRPGRGHLPDAGIEQLLVLLPQAAATDPGDRCRQQEHQAGLQGRLPQLQPETQPAAAVHHRLTCRPSSSGRRPGRTTRIDRPATCTAGCHRTPRRTSAASATRRALTVPANALRQSKMCESDENYVPLNDGYNWKGDPNATLSGQDVPQPPPGTPDRRRRHRRRLPHRCPSRPPTYDPATGMYVRSRWPGLHDKPTWP